MLRNENFLNFQNIVYRLVKNDFSDIEIEKVVGKYLIKVLKYTWSGVSI
jgi:microsomal dipeptidase-like Zn-dependent dipeptidase